MEYYNGNLYLHSNEGYTYRADGTNVDSLTQLSYTDMDELWCMGMAVDYTNGLIYEIGIDMWGDNYIAVFDPQTGDVDIGAMVADTNSWTIGIAITADSRIILCENYGSAIYEWHPDIEQLETLFEPDEVSSWMTVYYNPNEDVLYGAAQNNGGVDLYSISLESEEIELVRSYDITFAGMCDFCSIYDPQSVNVVPAEGIEMDVTRLSLGYGMTDYVAPRVLPTNATDRSFTLTSSAPEICAVDAEGNLTVGNTTGTAIITATSNDGGFKAECTVVVTPLGGLGNSLNIDGGELQFSTDHEFPFTTGKFGSRTVAWWRNKELFPTAGNMWIDAYLEAGDYIGFEYYTFLQPSSAEWMRFDVTATNTDTNEEYNLLHIITAGNTEDWVTLNYTIETTGHYHIKFFARQEGLIGNNIYGAFIAVDNVYVGSGIPATSLSCAESAVVKEARHLQMGLEIEPPEAMMYGGIRFETSDSSIATVDETGMIFGVSAGTAVIIATDLKSGLSADCIVTVQTNSEQRIYGVTSGIHADGYLPQIMSVSTEDATDYCFVDYFHDFSFVAVEYANDLVYGITVFPTGIGILNWWTQNNSDNYNNSEANIDGDIDGVLPGFDCIVDMAYSEYDNTMYVILKAPDETATYYLGVLDLETATIEISSDNMIYFPEATNINGIQSFTIDNEGNIIMVCTSYYVVNPIAIISANTVINATEPVSPIIDSTYSDWLNSVIDCKLDYPGSFSVEITYDNADEAYYAVYRYFGEMNGVLGAVSGAVRIDDFASQAGENLGEIVQYYGQPLYGSFPCYDFDFIYVIEDYGVMGDLNNDGHVTFADVGALYAYILGVDVPTHGDRYADFNGDGVVNFADVADLYSYIIGG